MIAERRDHRSWRILTAGDSAVVVSFGEIASEVLNEKVRSFWNMLRNCYDGEERQNYVPNEVKILEAVPTYRDVCVYYDPCTTDFEKLIFFLDNLAQETERNIKNNEGQLNYGKSVIVPTVYGGKYGPDLKMVAAYNGLSTEEVVQLHSEKPYLVYMIGFSPGYPYLGGLSQKLWTPRRGNPRKMVPAGAVGIGGQQTGVLTIPSPSGWNYIGMTPLSFFDITKDPPSLVEPGDLVTFVPISEKEAMAMGLEGVKYED